MDPRRRTIVGRVSPPSRPEEEVDLLVVHEELLVKQTHVLEHPPVNQQRAPQEQLNPADPVEPASVPGPLSPKGRKDMTPRDTSPGCVQTVRIPLEQDFGAIDPRPLLPGQFQQPGNRPGLQQDVVVQQEEVVGRRLAGVFFPLQRRPKDRVQGRSVASVLVQHYQTHGVPDRLGRTVGGPVVHDGDLQVGVKRGA